MSLGRVWILGLGETRQDPGLPLKTTVLAVVVRGSEAILSFFSQ